MPFVPLPSEGGWHFVAREHVIAVKHVGPKKASVIITGGITLETSEESHAVHRRIEAASAGPPPPTGRPQPQRRT
ncbi:MAG: hypothetical protein JOZ13_15585 [Alphaproteobacteria bacterium]|nr:hypothetical protein [Alphaproteobacteria bacterium]